MKKIISTALALLMLLTTFTICALAQEENMDYTKNIADIYLRDPNILVYEGKYYMYGTGASNGLGYGCYVSEDLENWAGPFQVYTPPAENFYGINNFWAPECHYYNGMFYLFATYLSSATNHRGVSVFRADNPLGPFEEITNGHITPSDWDAIDGTLYVDKDGQPWMVFVHEWTSMPDGVGDFSAAKMSADLTKFISEPIVLFKASDLPGDDGNSVTDGAWLYESKSGELLMIWSGFGDNGYVVAVARSENGKIDGKWKQNKTLLYEKGLHFKNDGGHGTIFTSLDGRLMMSIHAPNSSGQPLILELIDKGDDLLTKIVHDNTSSPLKMMKLWINWIIEKIKDFFNDLF